MRQDPAREGWRSLLRREWIATLAVLLIASRLLFTSDGFAPDFTNAIWLAGYQQHVIAAHLHPTLFLQTQPGGVFTPTSPSLVRRRR